MILSFAWTTDALLAGRKTCTRRVWKDVHFQRWVNAYRRGDLIHDAVDKVLFAGGKRIAKIRLTCEPYLEALRDMPVSDLQAEGDLWADKQEFISLFGGEPDKVVAVVRFELAEVA